MATEIVERMARRLCRANGVDPDAMCHRLGGDAYPWWKAYESSAEEFLVLMQAWFLEQHSAFPGMEVIPLEYQTNLTSRAIGNPRENGGAEDTRGTGEGE